MTWQPDLAHSTPHTHTTHDTPHMTWHKTWQDKTAYRTAYRTAYPNIICRRVKELKLFAEQRAPSTHLARETRRHMQTCDMQTCIHTPYMPQSIDATEHTCHAAHMASTRLQVYIRMPIHSHLHMPSTFTCRLPSHAVYTPRVRMHGGGNIQCVKRRRLRSSGSTAGAAGCCAGAACASARLCVYACVCLDVRVYVCVN